MSNELPQLSTMATTIVALHLNGNIATIGHVGDSRLYRIDGNGTLFRETQDHSVVEEEVRAGRMTPEQAANHPSRNIISRALGAEPTVEVDLKTIMIDPNTTFLICSDGITRHITDDELNALLFSAHEPSEICQRMKEICYERGAEDNLTAVIVRVLEQSADVQTEAADYEQDTVATARQPLAATAGFSDSGSLETQNAPQNFTGGNYETQKLQPEVVTPIPSAQPKIETTGSISAPEGYSYEIPKSEEKNQAVISYDDEKTGGGIFGKLIGGLALLLLGAVIGAAGYYFYARQQVVEVTPPVIQEQKPDENINENSILRMMYQADSNPEATIKSYQNDPRDAVDFYILGRANLILKNYPEAKKHFTEAKNRLAMADKENAKILATEIAMGLAIINGQFSIKEFEKELPAVTTDNTNTNNSANTNSLLAPSGEVKGADIQ
jgi:hypothetical protein